MPADSLCALLEHAIDYAGLFPPASLALEPALKNQAAYLRSSDRAMLGAFVLPVAQLEAASAKLAQFDRQHRFEISALGPKTENGAAFRATIEAATAAIGEFSARHGAVASVRQFEMALPPNLDSDSLGTEQELLGQLGLRIFWEAPASAAAQTIAALGQTGAGFKLRTGGVTADAFPTGTQIARALVAAVQYRVPIKFTAGLHHPVRQFHEEVGTKMHGFLNVLGAGVLAAEYNWSAAQTEEMLADENAESFEFSEKEFRWREWKITSAQIVAQRRLITSLGSCSFDEPRDDLRALQLL